MEIIRGTTPSIVVELEDGVNFSDLGVVKLRMKQGWTYVDKDPVSVSGNTAVFNYTEEETLKFYEGNAYIQLVGIKEANEEIVNKTDVYPITILKSLWNESVNNG